MKKLGLILFTVASFAICGCHSSLLLKTSEPDAKIYVDGNYVAAGSYALPVKPRVCQTVKIEKPGFVTEEKKYCDDVKGYTDMSRGTETFTLRKDDSYDASIKTDVANVDFSVEVNKKFTEDAAWKIVMQVVTNYFDDVVTSSKETGYLATSWKVQNFSQRTIRTRIIVKNSSASPLAYKIKIASEFCDQNNVSVKDDEKFKEWDRVLKKYSGVVEEFQARLGNK